MTAFPTLFLLSTKKDIFWENINVGYPIWNIDNNLFYAADF